VAESLKVGVAVSVALWVLLGVAVRVRVCVAESLKVGVAVKVALWVAVKVVEAL
jgi:hypothetical protein